MTKKFTELRTELDKRLDALPSGEGNAIRQRARAKLAHKTIAHERPTVESETFRTLYVDPGEDTGWCVARGFKLLAGGTEKMWPFADEVWTELDSPISGITILSDPRSARNGVSDKELTGPIGRIVCEDFRIYPWKVNELKWDRVRTARLIGALTFMARLKGIPFVLQPAAIKQAAQSAGAEELYCRPLHENRHENDAIQHFVFFSNTGLRGIPAPPVGEHPDG